MEALKNMKPMFEKVVELQDKWIQIKEFFDIEENQKKYEVDFKKFKDRDRQWFL